MTRQYPDVMNDLTDARLRFESGSVQYLAEFGPGPVAAGDVAQLVLTLQNTVDAPLHVRTLISLPRPRGKLRHVTEAPFEIRETTVRLTLQDGEVGQLILPVRIDSGVPPGKYVFGVRVESEARPGAARARPSSHKNQLEGLRIRYPQGLGITQIASWGYEAAKRQEQDVSLEVSEGTDQPSHADIAPQFTSVWMPQHWDVVAAAWREVNERRLHILPELTADRILVSMFRESPRWFAESGVQVHIAEALLVAKILTFTVTHLLSKVTWQDCLLVPILAYAQANDQPTGDVLWLFTRLGYTHVLELAIALSFTLVEDTVGRQAWSAAEQRAARDYIVESLNAGTPLPAEFLYLPLILGGLVVAREIVSKGEDVMQTIGLLREARAERADEFADPEWRDLDGIFGELVAKQGRTQPSDV
jgi:hypothetical protein